MQRINKLNRKNEKTSIYSYTSLRGPRKEFGVLKAQIRELKYPIKIMRMTSIFFILFIMEKQSVYDLVFL